MVYLYNGILATNKKTDICNLINTSQRNYATGGVISVKMAEEGTPKFHSSTKVMRKKMQKLPEYFFPGAVEIKQRLAATWQH